MGKIYIPLARIPDIADGIISKDFEQGLVGDCWLLAAIKSLMIKPKGIERLNNIIEFEEGNVKVTFPFNKKSYLITQEELNSSKKLSMGEMDIRAIEIAADRLLKEARDYSSSLTGGISSEAFKFFIGNGEQFEVDWDTFPFEIFNDENKAFTVQNGSRGKENCTLKHNDTVYKFWAGHAYSVLGADEEYIYLSNPMKSARKLSIPIKVFVSFFEFLDVCEL